MNEPIKFEKPPEVDQHTIGLYRKFDVIRIDGQHVEGGKHFGDEYFVLNLTTDKHSIPALAAYADSCEADYPLLAADLRAKVAASLSAGSQYITVPQVTLPGGLVVPSFQVAKYAMSRGFGDTAISVADKSPWVNISYHEARAACAAVGGNLITETQALAIAYDISQQDINWSGGKVGRGKIYQGIHKGHVSEGQPATYQSEDPDERRWHELSNGKTIFDFAGNVDAWIYDDVQGDENGIVCKPWDRNSPSLTTPQFPNRENGIGDYEASGDWSGRALLRGGFWSSVSLAGVFLLDRYGPDRRVDLIGFRCTRSL